MKYALLLNDMRWPNVENIAIVTISDNRQELVDWYTAQLAEKPHQDGQWGKPLSLDLILSGTTRSTT